jgi:hypothetical protein
MTDTIREQIISAGVTQLENILTTKGYNYNLGSNALRAAHKPDGIDCVVYWPGLEEYEQSYNIITCVMPFEIEALADYGANDKSEVSEKLLGDLLECILGVKMVYDFESGSTEPSVGDTLTGDTSGATGYIEAITLDSGTWAGGDAKGTVTLRRVVGVFQDENVNTNILTISEDYTETDPETAFTGGLGIITIERGGIETYSEEDYSFVGAKIEGKIKYEIRAGNPYGQP